MYNMEKITIAENICKCHSTSELKTHELEGEKSCHQPIRPSDPICVYYVIMVTKCLLLRLVLLSAVSGF